MDDFEQYLQVLKLSATTISGHYYNVKLFTQWLAKENYLDAADIGYNGLLAYIQYEKQKNVTPASSCGKAFRNRSNRPLADAMIEPNTAVPIYFKRCRSFLTKRR